MESKNKLSIAEQLRIAAEGAEPEDGGDYKSVIDGTSDGRDYKFKTTEPYVEPMIENKPTESIVHSEPIKEESRVSIPEPVVAPVKHSDDTKLSEKSILKVISIADRYRTLDDDIKHSINAFVGVSNNNINTSENLSSVIYGVLNTEAKKKNGLINLVRLKEEERTSRAFSLISLSDVDLLAVQDLTTIFNQTFIPKTDISANKILFCRELENGIETLPNETLRLLKPIHTLFDLSE